jgi:hypothetical protein
MGDSSRALQEALRLQPGLSIELVRQAYSFAEPEVFDRYLDGLRKAGWDG